uniref:Uncharacterized protein n=1 Tax=Strongyloides venezuelensis TaxID=75913 RepID=A0A0K0G5R2_STRVS
MHDELKYSGIWIGAALEQKYQWNQHICDAGLNRKIGTVGASFPIKLQGTKEPYNDGSESYLKPKNTKKDYEKCIR